MSKKRVKKQENGPTVMKKQDKCPISRRKKEILDILPGKAGKKLQNSAARRKFWTSRQESEGKRSKTPPQEGNSGPSARKSWKEAPKPCRKKEILDLLPGKAGKKIQNPARREKTNVKTNVKKFIFVHKSVIYPCYSSQ